MASDDVPNSVKEARERFDLFSDASLANRLQDQEFGTHFQTNRQERRLVGSDTKVSRMEQMTEIERQNALRREELNRVAETDEEMARRMQHEFDREEEVKRFLAQKQAEEDERIARELQQREQGHIAGYGSSSGSPPLAAPVPSSNQASSSTPQPHHIYSAQNNLNEHYAHRASTSLIDLGAEDALSTIPTPRPFHPSTNTDPFLSSSENRQAAYAPLNSVPLLPPPPEFVVRREQERVMEDLNRLQPRLALSGLPLPVAAAAAAASPPPAYAPVAPPPSEAAVASPTLRTPTAGDITVTNPFLVDLMHGERSQESGRGFFSEFGLPAPSSLARGDSTGAPSLI